MRSLRITHVVRSDSFAGVERYITEVATELASLGHEVTVVGGDPLPVRGALPAGVTHRPAASVRAVALALAAGGEQDVVHAHMSAAELAAVTTRPLHRAPVVATRHFAAQRGGSSPSRAITRTVARGLSLEISISQFVAERSGPGSVVLHNGVREQPHATDREQTVLVMQRHEPEKDTATTLRAFAASGLAKRGWRLQIAGRGSQGEDLRRLALALSVEADWLGFVDRPAGLLARAGVLLASAPAEPFGFSVVEAMASGTPVVACTGGAHAETVGPQGRLFPAFDVDACAHVLDEVCRDAPGRSVYGLALRDRQQSQFSLTAHVARLTSLYSDVVDGVTISRSSTTY